MKKILLLISFSLLLIFAPNAAAQFTLFQSPALMQFEIRRGDFEEDSVTVINETLNNKAHFLVYATDVVQDSSGNYKVVERGTSPWSCADWISIEDSDIVLNPQEGKGISFRISVPRNIRGGGRYAAIVSELVPEEKKEEAIASMVFRHRMVTIIEVSVPGRLKIDVKISKMEVLPAKEYDERHGTRMIKYGEDAVVFSTSLKNEGNIHVFVKEYPDSKMIIRDEKRRRLVERPLGTGRGIILPDSTVNFIYIKKGPPSGNYSAEAIIDYGGRRRARAEIPFTITAEEVEAAEMERLVNFRVPEKEEVELPARKVTRNLFFTIQNLEKEQIYVEAFAEPIEGVSSEWSAVPLIKIRPSKFKIGPSRAGRPREKRIRVRLVSGFEGGRYGRVVFKASLEEGGPAALEETPLYATAVDTLKISGEAVGEIAKIGEDLFYNLGFKNTGNVHGVLNGTVVIREKPLMKEIRTESFASKELVFPGENKEFQVSLSGLPSGEYVAEAVFSYDGKILKVIKEFTIE